MFRNPDSLKTRIGHSLCLSPVIAALMIGCASAADAQKSSVAEPAAESDEAASAISDIVVTGSRVARPGYAAPTPTTVVSVADIQSRGVTNIADLLNTIPTFGSSSSSRANTVAFTGSGQNYLNMRSLGAVRTLVLVDSARMVPSAGSGTFDLNLIPTIAIERSEVVTGGASAAYGSDAVAGVVNLITRRNFKGFLAQARAGVTQYGDGSNRNLAALYGTSSADDRLHLVIAGEFNDDRGVGNQTNRDWAARNVQVVTVTGGARIAPLVNFNNFRPGGLFFAGPPSIAGTAFTASGTPYRADLGTPVGGVFNSGGDNPLGYFTSIVPIQNPTRRYTAFANLGYDASDALKVTLGLLYGHSQSTHPSVPYLGVQVIAPDNAFLPAGIFLPAALPFGKINGGLEYISHVKGETGSARLKLEGRLGDSWKWDALGQYGVNRNHAAVTGDVLPANLARAVDAVRNSAGQIVCRVNADAIASNDDPACAPFNIFGVRQYSQAGYDYVTGTSTQRETFRRLNFAANLRGEPFQTWAGPVSTAIGYEYRRDKIATVVDSRSRAGLFDVFNNTAPANGTITVNETYFETVVPLLSDSPLAKELDLNGAVRRAWYDPGKAVTTWKIGATWEVNDDVRFRGTLSRDIRAPNLSEIFSGGTGITALEGYSAVGQPSLVRSLTGGNASLLAEKARTKSVGVAFTPTFLRGFHLTLDYYDIRVKDAIAVPAVTRTIVARCLAGNQYFCGLLTFAGNGSPPTAIITQVDLRLANIAKLRASGIDFDIGYSSRLGAGKIDASLLGTWTQHRKITDASGTLDYAGVSSGGILNTSSFSTPRWLATGIINYSNDQFGLLLKGNIVPRSKLDPVATAPAQLNVDHLPARFYLDLNGNVKAGKVFQIFYGVENVFNAKPPANLPYGVIGAANGSGAYYDTIGRRFFVGARVNY